MIYGHHMEYGAMFGALDLFYDESYLSAHQTGFLMTNAGKSYRLTVFASCGTLASEGLIFDPAETDRENLLRYIEENAAVFLPDNYNPDCPVLALSTCQGTNTPERLAVFCAMRGVTDED